jgi:hypothetical protein
MKNASSNFSELFNVYRLRSGFETFSEFGAALADKGSVYEDSIFSKWKTGDRAPHDRRTVLNIIYTFIENGGIRSVDEIDQLLSSLEQRNLTLEEEETVLKKLQVYESDPYSFFRPLVEPSAMFNNVVVKKNNTRFLFLDEIQNQKVRNYWQFQVDCATAEYYATISNGNISSKDFFDFYKNDDYKNNSSLLVAITTDHMTGKEYLAMTVRLVRGAKRELEPLNFINLMGINGKWPHERHLIPYVQVGEFDNFVLPNWTWGARDVLIKEGYRRLVQIANELSIVIIYSIINSFILTVIQEICIVTKEVPDVYPLYTQPEAATQYPIAYRDSQHFHYYWKDNPSLYVFEGFGLDKV